MQAFRPEADSESPNSVFRQGGQAAPRRTNQHAVCQRNSSELRHPRSSGSPVVGERGHHAPVAVLCARLAARVRRVGLAAHPREIITSLIALAAMSAPPLRPSVGVAVFVRSPDKPGCVLLGRRLSQSAAGTATWALSSAATPGLGKVRHLSDLRRATLRGQFST